MKFLKIAFVAAAIFVSTLSAHAELISFGVLGGSSNSHYSINGNDDAISNTVGYQVGLGATIKIPILSISPEVIYTNNKFEVTDRTILGGTCEVRDQKVDIPVVAGLSLLSILTLEAGPVFSIYNNADATYHLDSSNEDLGRINPGTGYLLGVKVTLFEKIVLGARYNGHFSSHSFGESGHNIRSHSYTFRVGFIL